MTGCIFCIGSILSLLFAFIDNSCIITLSGTLLSVGGCVPIIAMCYDAIFDLVYSIICDPVISLLAALIKFLAKLLLGAVPYIGPFIGTIVGSGLSLVECIYHECWGISYATFGCGPLIIGEAIIPGCGAWSYSILEMVGGLIGMICLPFISILVSCCASGSCCCYPLYELIRVVCGVIG